MSRLQGIVRDHQVRTLTTQGSTLLTGQLVAAALAFALSLILARGLGPVGYGQFALILTSVTIVAQVIDARVWEAATRYASQHLAVGERTKARAVLELAVATNLVGGLLATGVIVVLSGIVADDLLGDADLADSVAIYGLIAPFVAVQNACAVAFRVFERFRVLAVLTALSPSLRLAVAAAVLIAGGELSAVIPALVVAEGLAAVAYVGVTRRQLRRSLPAEVSVRERLGSVRGDVREMGGFLAMSNLQGSLRLANEQIDVLLVGIVSTPTAAGTLKLAKTFVQPIGLIQRPFYEAIYPRLTRARAEGTLADAWRLIRRITPVAAATLFAGALVVSVASPWLIPGLAGEGFADTWEAVIPLSIGMALAGAVFWIHPSALAIDLQRRAVAILTIATLIQIVLVLLLVPEIGIAGAGIAYAAMIVTWAALLGPAVRERMLALARSRPEVTGSVRSV
jgi:O-antigen/teichoic acid export membrane protein